MKKIAITGDGGKPGVKLAIDQFAKSLDGKADVALVDTDGSVDLSDVDADVLVVFGGDGSMLSAARRLNGRQVSVVGVHMGRFGFLTHFEADSVEDDFETLLSDNIQVEKWMMLRCTVKGGPGEEFDNIALNEAVVGSGGVSRMLSVELYINDEHAATYRGDGVIVASPAGSTAHSLSAGGPIVSSAMAAFVLTPVCPHTLTNRPLVIPPESKVLLRPGGDARLTLDGQVNLAVGEKHEILVERAPFTFNVATNRKRTYYGSLKEKLDWGRSPTYDKG